MSKVSRAEKLLNSLTLAPSCELSKEGAQFVKQRFDPYHDLPMKPSGYPDGYNGHTVSRCIKKTITVSATTGGGSVPTTTWNCHIFQTPIQKPLPFAYRQGARQNNFEYALGGNDTVSTGYGGLMIQRSDNDGPEWTYPQSVISTNVLGRLQLGDADLKNVMRVTSQGFEVIDQTAELYKQGTLTAYRQNLPTRSQAFFKMKQTDSGANQQRWCDCAASIVKTPPISTSDAMLIPDTKQWLCREGAYVVIDYNDIDLPMLEPQYKNIGLVDDSSDYPMNNSEDVVQWMGVPTVSGATTITIPTSTPQVWTYCTPPQTRIDPINQSGIFLTGLNPQATITINKIWYVECAPTGEDEELLSLCSQSPAYDSFAMMLVSKLRRDCPVAVKLYENYMGEWFFNGIRDVINTVTPWLSNAQVVASGVKGWIDSASTNDGYINPQSFVKGPVATKVMREKSDKSIPKPPGPAPAMRAYKPIPLKKKAFNKAKPQAGGPRRRRTNDKKTRNEIMKHAATNKHNLSTRQR